MTSKRPLIGLPGRRKKTGSIDGFPESLAGLDADLYLADYAASVLRAGGLPVHLPVGTDPALYLDVLDGIVLTGGADVEPTRYDAANTASDAEPIRDDFEFALLEHAIEHDIPVLGICRGMQILNVVAGGTLHQDVPSHARYDLDPGDRSHGISFVDGTRIAALYGQPITVNSLHHQTIDRVGTGLVVAGSADDGTIEALELADRQVLAVQWHPEMLDVDEPIWAWLVKAASVERGA